MRAAMASVPVPEGLKSRIVQAVPPRLKRVVWKQPMALAAAAALVLLGALGYFWQTRDSEFQAFTTRMARFALRDYRMEIETSNTTEIRNYLARRNAPADYQLRPGMEKLPALGCGIVRWRNEPVSMICLDRGQKQVLWLFVADPKLVPGAPKGTRPVLRQVGNLAVVTWTDGQRLYLAGVRGGPDALKPYL
jgi:hypothetical protein